MRNVAAGILLAITLLAQPFGCGQAPPSPQQAEGGGGATSDGFAGSECYDCVSMACSFAIGACESEPSCATYLECVQACPVAASGNAESTCESACAKPEGSAALQAQSDLTQCRLKGEGANCAPCGIDNAATHPVLSQQCNPSNDDKACGKCVDEKCCESLKTCASNSSCVEYVDCTSVCKGDPACNQACGDNHADGVADYLDFAVCTYYHCADTCGLEEPCEECVAHECTNTWVACTTDPVCWQLAICLVGCPSGDLMCVHACRNAATPEALAASDSLLLCREHSCSGACGF